METILDVLAIFVLIVEVILLYQLRANRHELSAKVRSMVLFGIIVFPLLALLLGNYHVFVSSKESTTCQSCHVMSPMANDMMFDSHSQTLAARHYQNGWIAEHECYSCHADYGFQGTMKAKLDGYRHLMRYVTKTYTEPIRYRGEFNSMNCYGCHQGSRTFEAVDEHAPVVENLMGDDPSISCLNCHGRAHPEPSKRTPGSKEYKWLSDPKVKEVVNAQEVKDYINTLAASAEQSK
ncbi:MULTISPECIES: NapC/NirT family cytochrome c [unclassified Flammeovirga]|uniref:NapC/NirT family cytochrome c n=1 Tax=unclassified Flammeovirga TaxID=2637820 RepID=UPI000694E8BD|nr:MULTISPECIES: NapC/NirT family cytochrome c [unclassified Flammeovirga]MBD0401137.1 NapC/NirT family cytochrome c [Flammeovirga sp. EKP202]